MKLKQRQNTGKVRVGRLHLPKLSIVAFTCIFASTGVYLLISSFAATSDVANLWVDQNGGSCQRSATQISYGGAGDTNSCSSLQAACNAAASGDLVLIQSGTNYNFTISNCKKTSMTTFRVPDDQRATVGPFNITDSDWVTVDGGAQRALLTQTTDNNPSVFSKCANHVTFSHIEVNGNGHDGDGFQIGWPNDCTSSYLKLDHSLLYGLVYKGGNHTDCIQAASSYGSFIIDSNRLMQCGDGAMQFTDGGDWGAYASLTGLQNVKVTNNWINNKINYGFGRMGSGDLLFQNNTYFGNSSTQFNNTSNQKIYGNIFYWYQNYDCTLAAQGGTYGGTADFKYNATNVDCPGGTNTTKITSPIAALFTNFNAAAPQDKDLHLASGTTQANNTVPAGYYDPTDMDGNARSGTADAGADEYGGVQGPVDTTNPTATLTAPSGGATVSGASVVVSATASDDTSVSQVEFFIDGQSVGTDSSSPYSINWDSRTVTNGSHTVQAKAYDPTGNVGSSATRTITTSNSSVCSASSSSWQNQSFAPQSSTFTFDYDATPSANNIDSVLGLSDGAAAAYADLAAAIRFSNTGVIDVRNGASYTAASTYSYAGATSYHFTITVNTTAHTYTVEVTPYGGSKTTLAANYAFRSEQATVSQINNWATLTGTGSQSTCGVAVAAASSSAPTNTTAPTISGTTRVGSTLTTTNGTWGNSPTSYTYQWQVCNSSGASCTNATGTGNTTASYKLSCSDYRAASSSTVRVVVTASNTSGSTSSTSSATAAVNKPSTPTKGDFNDDCFINSADLSQFISGWRKTPTGSYTPLDITGPTPNTPDTYIDGWDLNMLVSNYGYRG